MSPGDDGKKPVALIAGPTASGKSAVAVELALALAGRGRRGAVINADSMQVYRDLRVLSARPSEDEMRGIEHRLFGTWDGAQACSAAEWAAAAKREIEDAHRGGAVPILCGGTGLYIRTLLQGIAPVPPIDPDVRETVRSLEQAEAYAALQAEDPARAAQVAPADSQRTSRALEVVRSTGKSVLRWQEALEGGIEDSIDLHPLVLLPERERLYARCDERFETMLEDGAVAEVEALLARGLSPDLPVMRAIGVPEIAGWLTGAFSRDEMVTAGRQATRNYAKRQYTWFRRQSPDTWSRISEDVSVTAQFASLLQ